MKKRVQHLFSAITISTFLVIAFGSGEDENNKSLTTDEVIVENSLPDVEILKHNATYEEVMDAYTIHCRVRNNSSELINYLDIKATFYDKKGNIVGTGMGNAANLAGGAEKTIDVMGLDIQNCESYEVAIDNIIK